MIEINPADPQLMYFLKNQTLKEDLKYRRSVLQKMLGPWNVQYVQVSMDGDEQSYIQRKQY